MGCRRYRNALSEAAAGTLPPERQREINEHLARCSACAQALDRLKRSMAAIDRAFAESAEAEPSPELLRGLERRLQAQTESHWPRISYALLAAAAAGLAGVVAAWAPSGPPRWNGPRPCWREPRTQAPTRSRSATTAAPRAERVVAGRSAHAEPAAADAPGGHALSGSGPTVAAPAPAPATVHPRPSAPAAPQPAPPAALRPPYQPGQRSPDPRPPPPPPPRRA